ncbi:hypothetical protein GOB94_13030 [Granulicella sp. 5B5]|uniref:cytochrome c oxidase assembly factor Coa1 family protein n=1 Tax=Granulicella sp. 5B5 TaxID=1617967 RepID=UPI0015F3C051|nr:cytochrome c oxidase assembly factor Coa1 family protein [Granulicella sp. 5B5]QMV19505.1 hypothetical protein GOB94_13030 [Granulicella sp. 5B5]
MPSAAPASAQGRPRRGIPLWGTVLLCLLGFLVLMAAFIGSAFYSIQGSVRRSQPYHMALAQAGQATCVTKRLGTPLVPRRFVVGSVSHDGNQTNGNGYSDLEIPVRGPLASGRVHVVARETDGTWTIEYLSVRTGNDRLLLLPAAAPCQ